MNFSPRIVTVCPTVLLMVLNKLSERVRPRTTERVVVEVEFSVFSDFSDFSVVDWSVKNEPKRRVRGSILIKSELVPRIGTEAKVFLSEETVLVEIATGATAVMLLMLEIVLTSSRLRLEFWKELAEVNSSIILVIVPLSEVGRTTMSSSPSAAVSDLTRLEILPISEKIRIMLATPMAMPIQVKNERVRLALSAERASL